MNYQAVEKTLLAKLEELENRLAHVTKDMSAGHSADFAEQVTERENDEVLDGIGEEAQISIAHIRAALTRIHEGTYGRCANCDNAINPERLEVLPETALCIRCASA